MFSLIDLLGMRTSESAGSARDFVAVELVAEVRDQLRRGPREQAPDGMLANTLDEALRLLATESEK